MRYYTDKGITRLLKENPWSADKYNDLPLDRLIRDLTRACRHTVPDSSLVILDRIRHLLGVMKSQQGDRPEVVPFRSVVKLSEQILNCLSPPILFEYYWQYERHCDIMCFLAKVLELLLSSGADLKNRAVVYTHFTSKEYTGKFKKMVARLATLAPDQMDFKMLHLKHHHSLMLRYGYQPDETWFDILLEILKLKPTTATDPTEFVVCSINMMDTDTLHSFHTAIRKQTTKPYPINFYFSLQHQCRRVLYQNVPKRRMALYVNHLPLPTQLKQFYIFEENKEEKIDE